MIEPRQFERGDKKIFVNLIEGEGWNFQADGRSSDVIYSVVENYLHELSPELLFGGFINIGNSSRSAYPFCFCGKYYNFRTILLCVELGLWNQLTYQLAHELTHYFLKDNGHESALWFFEVLAAAASLYFLKKMAIGFAASKSECFVRYAPNFMNYRYRQLMHATASISDPKAWLQKHESHLLSHKTDRELNLQVAKKLLPLLESQPGCWNILLYAPLENSPLNQFLQKWISRVPARRDSERILLETIHTVFCGNN